MSPARPMEDREHTWLLQCERAVGPPGQGRAGLMFPRSHLASVHRLGIRNDG